MTDDGAYESLVRVCGMETDELWATYDYVIGWHLIDRQGV
jgi:hypothetical protein